MRRVIKFRAWDTIKKMFVPQGEIIFADYGDNRIEVNPNCIEYIGDDCHNGEPQRSRFIIVQFTGLTDKNGKEIYEGDLVKFKEDLCEIYFDFGGFRIRPFPNSSMSNINTNVDFEVIGNIYEHPNLIK